LTATLCIWEIPEKATIQNINLKMMFFMC